MNRNVNKAETRAMRARKSWGRGGRKAKAKIAATRASRHAKRAAIRAAHEAAHNRD